jgi:hypothetical protein
MLRRSLNLCDSRPGKKQAPVIQHILGVESRIFGILESNNPLSNQPIDDDRQPLILFHGSDVDAEMLPRRFKHRLRVETSFFEITSIAQMPEKFGLGFHVLVFAQRYR